MVTIDDNGNCWSAQDQDPNLVGYETPTLTLTLSLALTLALTLTLVLGDDRPANAQSDSVRRAASQRVMHEG